MQQYALRMMLFIFRPDPCDDMCILFVLVVLYECFVNIFKTDPGMGLDIHMYVVCNGLYAQKEKIFM